MKVVKKTEFLYWIPYFYLKRKDRSTKRAQMSRDLEMVATARLQSLHHFILQVITYFYLVVTIACGWLGKSHVASLPCPPCCHTIKISLYCCETEFSTS